MTECFVALAPIGVRAATAPRRLEREERVLEPTLRDVAVARILIVSKSRPARAKQSRIGVRKQQRIGVEPRAIEKSQLFTVTEHVGLDDAECRPAASAADRERGSGL